MCRGTALQTDCGVTEADGAVAGTNERLANDRYRIRKVKQPRLWTAPRELLGDGERWRNGAKCLGPSAWANGLLAKNPMRQWDRLINDAGLRAADAVLHQTCINPVRRLALAGR